VTQFITQFYLSLYMRGDYFRPAVVQITCGLD